MPKRILLIEDEPGLVLTLTDRLEGEGYEVESRTDGESGVERALAGGVDLILLDIGLPKKSGFEVCRRVREAGSQAPILMLTARGQIVDKVVGLKTGADDYVTKPFDMMELLARIEALLRRASAPAAAMQETVKFGDIEVDTRKAQVRRGGEPVPMSMREYELLKYLVAHRGRVVSRDELLREVWGYEPSVASRTVDTHVGWLRQKLESDAAEPQWIVTVRGVGYRFDG
ncbi:MAG: response regulator transcription factor [Bryobacteraceae bacterium]|nr:response regulator transcription factor [Bryobacteraceae bacterium]